MSKLEAKIPTDSLEPLIYLIRDTRVMLDADLARLYGATTKRFNEAFKRNRNRFPQDFAFKLTQEEWNTLLSAPQKGMWSQIATTSQKYRRFGSLPWAFTEHGALMAANILRSDRAVEMSVFVIRAFVKLREHTVANTAILKRLAEIDNTLRIHDRTLRDLYHK